MLWPRWRMRTLWASVLEICPTERPTGSAKLCVNTSSVFKTLKEDTLIIRILILSYSMRADLITKRFVLADQYIIMSHSEMKKSVHSAFLYGQKWNRIRSLGLLIFLGRVWCFKQAEVGQTKGGVNQNKTRGRVNCIKLV